MTPAIAKTRIDWVDYAKGLCIIMVVMMHSTLGVEKAAGAMSWMNHVVEWARPFRMPDFFLISGLFLASRINKPWRSYLDSKVLHFAYFYVLWTAIQFATKSYGMVQDVGAAGALQSYLLSFIQPFGTLWFIYMLPVFFVTAKLLRPVPPLAVFLAAALLQMGQIHTGWLVIDEFAARFVYFFAGFWLAPQVFAFAARVGARPVPQVLAGLCAWAMVNGIFVVQGWATLPGVSLALGFVGAAAVVTVGVLLSKLKAGEAIRYCGENSIVIYLAFFLFMAAGRSLLLKLAPGLDLGIVSLAVTAAGVVGPILLFWAVRRTPLVLLFRRPHWARLASLEGRWHSAPHGQTADSQAR
jgi:uncharacterized membrane protein YcfT